MTLGLPSEEQLTRKRTLMGYEPKDYSSLLGIEGLSDELLQNHFKLYQGYVTNTNKLSDTLRSMDATTPEYAELKRRFGWEFNGMRLHELYFESITASKKKGTASDALVEQMDTDFGDSPKSWTNDFVALSSVRGIGWTVLYYDPVGDRMYNTWINEHDLGHLAGGIPLLVLDCFEHAFMIDYGLKKADYIETFMDAIDWNTVNKRYEAAKNQ